MHDDEYEREGFSPLGKEEGSGTAATGTNSATSDSAWIRARRCLLKRSIDNCSYEGLWGLWYEGVRIFIIRCCPRFENMRRLQLWGYDDSDFWWWQCEMLCICTSNYCSVLSPLSVPEKRNLFRKSLSVCLDTLRWCLEIIPFEFRQWKIFEKLKNLWVPAMKNTAKRKIARHRVRLSSKKH